MALWTRRGVAAAALITLALWIPSTASAQDAEPDAPSWWREPPRSDAEWLWGTGQGTAVDDARRAALKSIAAQLRVSVSAEISQVIQERNGKVDASTRSSLLEEVDRTEFSSPVLEAAAFTRSGAYALVKVDRRAFVRETSARFDTAVRLVREATRGLSSRRAVEQVRALQVALPNVRGAMVSGHLLQAVDQGAAREQRYAILSDLAVTEQRATQAAKALVFYLECNPADADVGRVVRAFVNDGGMRVTEARDAAAVVVGITAAERLEARFGNKKVFLLVTLTVRDGDGSVGSKQYDVIGSSTSDYGAARRSALAQLGEAVRQGGLGL